MHREYTSHLKADISRFNKLKPTKLSALEKAYNTANRLAGTVVAGKGTATGENARMLKRNTASLAGHVANASLKAEAAAKAKYLWEAAKAAVSPSKTILQLFKPSHIALTTLPPVAKKVLQRSSVKENSVRTLTDKMLTIAQHYGIIYDKTVDHRGKIELNLKDIALQAHAKLTNRIIGLTHPLLSNLTDMLIQAIESKTSISEEKIKKAVAAVHQQIEHELGLVNNTAVDYFKETPTLPKRIITPVGGADGTKPLFDLQQVAIYALKDLEQDALKKYTLATTLLNKALALHFIIKLLTDYTQNCIDVFSSSSGKEGTEDEKKSAVNYLLGIHEHLNRIVDSFRTLST